MPNTKKNKVTVGSGCKDKSGAPLTPPQSGDNMNHVTGQDRRNDFNPQNNEVEEMDTQDGKSTHSTTNHPPYTHVTKQCQSQNIHNDNHSIQITQ